MVIIYSLETCPYCTELKEGLEKEGIKYEDRDVSLPKYKKDFKQMYEMSGKDSVPIMVIDRRVFAPDVSFSSIDEAVLLAKEFNQS